MFGIESQTQTELFNGLFFTSWCNCFTSRLDFVFCLYSSHKTTVSLSCTFTTEPWLNNAQRFKNIAHSPSTTQQRHNQSKAIRLFSIRMTMSELMWHWLCIHRASNMIVREQKQQQQQQEEKATVAIETTLIVCIVLRDAGKLYLISSSGMALTKLL